MTARVLVAAVLALAGCAELPPLTERCGNGIIEQFEDCDNPSPLCVQCGRICGDGGQCPFGTVCGVDDMCHGPSGEFADATTRFPLPSLGYRIVDVDFDRYGDVVALNQTSLITRYGDPEADLGRSSIVVTPPLQGSPALTRLDDRADLVIPVTDGLVAYTGVFGVPSPRQFSLNIGGVGPGGRPDPDDVVQIDKTIAMVGRRARSSSTLTIAVLDIGGVSIGCDAETQDFCGATYDVATFQRDSIISYRAGDTTFVGLKPNASTLCVLAVERAPHARGADPSCPVDASAENQSCAYTIRSLVALPAAASAVFADLDGDGCPSVLDGDGGANAILEHAGTVSGASCTIASATTSLPPMGQPADAELVAVMPLDPPVTGLVSEALVTTYSIIGLQTATRSPSALYIADRPIIRARVGDLNGDDRTDLALLTPFPNLDLVHRVPGSGYFLLSRQSTPGIVTHAVIGDFDGDTRNDLAYSERLGDEEQLSIMYGTAGGLLPGTAVDAFERVLFLAVMAVRDSSDPFNIVDDLLAVDVHDDIGGDTVIPEITLLHGSSNRTMLSYYGSPLPDLASVYRGVVAGHFVDDGASADLFDLLAFQTFNNAPTRLLVIPGLPFGQLGLPQYSITGVADTSGTMGVCNPDPGALPQYPFCLFDAGFASVTAEPGRDIVFGVEVAPGFQSPTVVRIDPSDPTLAIQTYENVFRAGGRVRFLEQLDVDRDGRSELVVSFRTSDGDAGDGYTMICNITPDIELGTCVDVAADIVGNPDLECLAFARGGVTPPCEATSDQPDLAVLCRDGDGSIVYEITGEGGRYAEGRTLIELPGKRLWDVQLGDVTGDQLDDLVVVSDELSIPQLEVHRQWSSRETNVCVDQ